MLDTVVFEEPWQNIKVSAYTDLYAYDPEDGAVLFISLAGNEQIVKAISSAIVACKVFGIKSEAQPELLLNGHPASRYRILSTKLGGGSLHQIVADSRFYPNSDTESRLVAIPTNTEVHEAIYAQVLAPLASPVIPAWAQYVCDRLREDERLREMAGTLRVVDIAVDENVVDKIVTEGMRMGRINFTEQGGAYAGFH